MAGEEHTIVVVGPTAGSFACLCEPCLEAARSDGVLFAEALRLATVHGAIDADARTAVARCAAGHEIVLRRVERPPRPAPRDGRQLQPA